MPDEVTPRRAAEHLAVVPADWSVKIFRPADAPPFAVATHPGRQPRYKRLDQMPCAFDAWEQLV